MGSQQQDDITTFSGFGSWIQSQATQGPPAYQEEGHEHGQGQHARHIIEIDSHEHDVHELDSGAGWNQQRRQSDHHGQSDYHAQQVHELDNHANRVYELGSEKQRRVVELPDHHKQSHVHELPASQWENQRHLPQRNKPADSTSAAPAPVSPFDSGPEAVVYRPYDSGPEVVYEPYDTGPEVVNKPYVPIYDPPPQPYKPQPLPPVEPRPIRNKIQQTKKTLIKEIPDPMTRIEIKGLEKHGQKGGFIETLNLPATVFLEDVAKEVQKRGYKLPIGFVQYTEHAQPLTIPFLSGNASWPILLTTGRPCYDPEVGLRMHIDEPFSVFLARIQLSTKCVDDRISINDGDLKIAFHRTLRVPEDGRVHKLPASFGRFPIKNIAAYQKKLVGSKNTSLLDMAKKGGIFFPIFQREAMWISFSANENSEYKIRVFVGGVNVITGKKWDHETKNKGVRAEENQDYVLVPPQKHLDGIAIGNGVVQQFVAMPIGSGYSIEKQITGREDVGGVQLEITPNNQHFNLYHRDREIRWSDDDASSTLTTPHTLGIQPGDMINMTHSGSPDKAPFLSGQKRERRKIALREVLGLSSQGFAPSNVNIKALYPVSFVIKVPGTLTKSKILTGPLSPLDTIETILKKTVYKGKNLMGFRVSFDGTMLDNWEPILQTGLRDGDVLTAHKSNSSSSSNVPGGRRHSGLGVSSAQQRIRPNRFSSPPVYNNALPQMVGYSGVLTAAPPKPVSNEPVYDPQAYASYKPATYSPSPATYSLSPASTLPTYSSTYPELLGMQQEEPLTAAPSSSANMPAGAPAPSSYSAMPSQPPMQSAQPSNPAAYGFPSSPAMHASMPSYDNVSPPSPIASPGSASPEAPSSPISPLQSTPSPQSMSYPPRMAVSSAPPQQPKPIPKPKPKDTESWAMNLAPGGRLSQQIHLDPTPPTHRSTSHAATALINIQLLNAVAYETLTGLFCPPTPITPKQYLDANIPWYDSYEPSARAVSGGAAFASLRSIAQIDAETDIQADVSLAQNTKVACVVCRRNLCDVLLRPCNHAFCRGCVMDRMVYRNQGVTRCLVCGAQSERVVGFSAPMSLPGYEDWVPDLGGEVVVKVGRFGRGVVFELE